MAARDREILCSGNELPVGPVSINVLKSRHLLKILAGGGQGGPWALSDFEKLPWALSAGSKMGRSAERWFFPIFPIFSRFYEIFEVDF